MGERESPENACGTAGSESFSLPERKEFPERITLELTNHCNLNCTFCPRKLMARHQGFMDSNLAKSIFDEMSEHLPVALVPFFRGETLLHPDWVELLAYAKERGIGPIQFTTNATLLNQQAAEDILDLGLDFVSFSLDTIDPEIYMKSRRGANYFKVLENILGFLDLRRRRGMKQPEVQVSCVETAAHRPGLDAFVEFWRPKVDRVRIYVEHSGDGHPGSIQEPLPGFERRQPCFKVFTDMVIYWDGEVALCNHDWTRDRNHRIGNVKDAGIRGVWKSQRYESIREAHRAGELAGEPPCDHCDHWKMFYLPEGYLGKIYFGKNDVEEAHW
ncbi:MAG: radical SAM protein [Deltaproteobacteria bacterium]|nr:radical SAM protein [Deltaproteobacteria bacterium]MBW2094945.1 radical SAM protein [Deltaproteobacteria bacterium]